MRSARNEIQMAAARFGIPGDVLASIATEQVRRDAALLSEYQGRTPSPEIARSKADADAEVQRLMTKIPNALSEKCVSSLAAAYLYVETAVAGLDHGDPGPQEAAELMQLMMMLVGSAVAHGDPNADPRDQFIRHRSENGKKGGQKRHARTTAVKEWALEEAKSMKGSDMEIARQLANRIPAHLVGDPNKAGDAARLIYDALRAQRQAKQP